MRVASSLWFLGLLPVALALGCGSSGGNGYSLNVGTDDGGASFLPGSDDASTTGGLDAHIEQDHITVTFVTLTCAGPCADVVAVATGGQAPYTFKWDDGSTSASRHVCPTSSTDYFVNVTDTGTAGELAQPAETVQVPLQANVIACPDGGSSDRGMCEPGSYSGTWSTPPEPIDGGTTDAGGNVLSGPLTLVLVDAASDGGTGLVPSGELTLNWDLVGVITARLSGQLDCATGAFRGEDPMAPFTAAGLPAGTCDVTFAGQYSSTPASISGQYTLVNCSDGSYSGSWTVTLTP
jgi:hypothetical protein